MAGSALAVTIRAMQRALRRYFAVLAGLLIVLSMAAYVYSDVKKVPWDIAIVALPAFLLEAALYAACGVAKFREALARMKPKRAAAVIVVSALLPYCLYCLAMGLFSFSSFAWLVLLVSASAYWFILLPRHGASDAIYLLLLAGPILAKTFAVIYTHPVAGLQVFMLGVVMWYRTSLLSILTIRKMENIGFGFFPTRVEWWIGIRNFLLFLPVGLALGYSFQFIQLREQPITWQVVGLALATFFGVLWVLAVAEEFFFRGYLQQLIARVVRNSQLSLVITSLVFGAAHLGFGGQFPNWRFALLSALAGIFYGLAFQQGRGIRAAMVTHALIVTVWRTFLKVVL